MKCFVYFNDKIVITLKTGFFAHVNCRNFTLRFILKVTIATLLCDDIIEMPHSLVVEGVMLNDTMRFLQGIIYEICKNIRRILF